MQTLEEFDRSNMKWALFGLLLLMLMLAIFGCASREPSNTDHHYRAPQVNCGLVRVHNQIVEQCCQQDTCWFVN